MELLKHYLRDLFNTASHSVTREESFYPALKRMLDNYAELNSKVSRKGR